MAVYHPSTDAIITHLSAITPQSLLLSGPHGIGLSEIARTIAHSGQLRYEIRPDSTKAAPIITVAMVRELYQNSRSRSNGKQFIIIHEADTMTPNAQAAFLKLLEEPGRSLHFILTSHDDGKLLPTIRSRVERYNIQPISAGQSDTFLTELGVTDSAKRRQLLFIAGGLPEELERLASDEMQFTQAVERMKDAQMYINAKPYEQLLVIQKYKDDRDGARQLVRAAIRILRQVATSQPRSDIMTKLDRLIDIDQRLLLNGNVRLQLSRFVV